MATAPGHVGGAGHRQQRRGHDAADDDRPRAPGEQVRDEMTFHIADTASDVLGVALV
jgi:hypothetical protein